MLCHRNDKVQLQKLLLRKKKKFKGHFYQGAYMKNITLREIIAMFILAEESQQSVEIFKTNVMSSKDLLNKMCLKPVSQMQH